MSFGAAGQPPDAECVELVVLLALQPAVMTDVDVAAAMWPGSDAGRALVAARGVVERTGCWLAGAGGAPWRAVVAGESGRLEIRPRPVVDSDVFRQAVRDGRPVDRLDLLRGPVLDGRPRRRYSWAATSGLEGGLNALVVDTCARLARRRLAAADPDGARAAAQAGLRVVPLDERLWRELLRAEEAFGRHTRVVELGRELSSLLRRELAPYDTMRPETRALLAELRRFGGAGRRE